MTIEERRIGDTIIDITIRDMRIREIMATEIDSLILRTDMKRKMIDI